MSSKRTDEPAYFAVLFPFASLAALFWWFWP